MQVTSEAVSGVTRRLNVSVPTSRVNEQFEARLKRTAKTVKINGFRPGKVPVNVVRREYGAGIYQEVVSDIIRDTVFEAIQQEKINAVGMPNIEKSELKDDALVYEATVEVYPEVNVKFDGLEVERKASEVNDKDVDQMIENLQKQRASWAETKGMAKKDMQVTFDFEGSVDGEKFEGGSAEDFKLVLGSGRMIPGFEDGIVGMKKGEEKVIDVTFPEDYQAEDLKGKEATFKVVVHEIKTKQLPALDDEFAKDVDEEVESLDELKAKIRKELEESKNAAADGAVQDLALRQAVDNAEIVELPHVMVHDEVHRQMDLFLNDMQRQGISPELYYQITGTTEHDLHVQMEADADVRTKTSLVLEQIIKDENIVVSEEEIAAEVEELAKQYNMDADRVRGLVSSDMLTNDIQMKKAMSIITDSAIEE